MSEARPLYPILKQNKVSIIHIFCASTNGWYSVNWAFSSWFKKVAHCSNPWISQIIVDVDNIAILNEINWPVFFHASNMHLITIVISLIVCWNKLNCWVFKCFLLGYSRIFIFVLIYIYIFVCVCARALIVDLHMYHVLSIFSSKNCIK